MARWVMLGQGGAVDAEKVIAVMSALSTPVKRMLKLTPKERVFNMTYGYPRRSVMLLDNGCLAVVSLPVDELAEHLNQAVTNHE